jgi:myo-inositol-1(or 4)-monophosphatase
LVATGFSYVGVRRAWQAALLTHVLPVARDIRRSGAAAIDLCWVAAGRVDAFYEWGLQPWDVAAGALVATEAGALVKTVGGGPSTTDITVAAPPHLIDELCDLLRRATDAHPFVTSD